MNDRSLVTGYVLDELEEQVIPPTAELDVVEPCPVVIVATIVLVICCL